MTASRPQAAGDATLAARRDFAALWSAHGVSLFGSLVTRVAIPFTAALVLHVPLAQLAVLNSADLIASLAVGLFAGAWVDRLPRRPLLIACDLARAAALVAVPAAALSHHLTFTLLLVVQAACGVFNTLFDVARSAYLPSLVGADGLVEANAQLAGTGSIAEMSAFGIAGWLVQWLTGPVAVAVDAVSFVVSAGFLAAIRTTEPRPEPRAHESAVRAIATLTAEVREGLAATFGEREQRSLALADALMHFMFGTFMASYTFYCTRELGLPAGPLGMIYGLGGVSGLAAAWLAPRLGARFGQGRVMAVGLLTAAVGFALATLAPAHAAGPAMALLAAQQLVGDGGLALFVIHAGSRRMELAADHLRGRVASASRFLSVALMLAGVTFGGVVGTQSSARVVLACGTGVLALAALAIALSGAGKPAAAPAA